MQTLESLPCFNDWSLPSPIAKIEVEIVHPDYRDTRFFNGFGLRTPEMSEALHWQIFGGGRAIYREFRLRALQAFGSWQTNCPSAFESNSMNHTFSSDERSSSVGWHFDVHNARNLNSELILIGEKTSQGPTLCAPIRVACELQIQSQCPASEQLRQLLTNNREYDEVPVTSKIEDDPREEGMLSIDSFRLLENGNMPVIQHFYSPTNAPSKDFVGSTIAMSEFKCMHAGNPTGGTTAIRKYISRS